MLHFVLRLPGAQPLGEVVPDSELARVGHFEDAADVARGFSIQESLGLVGVAVDGARTVSFPPQEAHG